MTQPSNMQLLSDAIGRPIIKAYRAGGLGLVFILAGTLLLLTTLFLGEGLFQYVVATIGTIMISFVLVLFYFQDIRKLKKADNLIKDNKELIDTVQQTAIEMTDLAYNLQSLAFKHADLIVSILNNGRDYINNIASTPEIYHIPGIDKLQSFANSNYVVKSSDLSGSIVSISEEARHIIADIKMALVECDPSLLKKYFKELRNLNLKVKGLLSEDSK